MEFVCDLCERNFKNAKSLSNHVRWCSGKLTKKDYPIKRICILCGQEKDISKFRKLYSKRAKRYYPTSYCNKCEVTRAKEYHKLHPEWSKKTYHDSHTRWVRRMVGYKCLICGESRVLDIAHIIARKGRKPRVLSEWWNEKWNLLGLCPNHHRLFDQNKLTDGEYSKIKQLVEECKKIYETKI